MNLYHFNSAKHLHELFDAGQWRPLIGTSSVLGVIAKPLTWWASGLAVKEFGCPDPKVLTKIKNKKATEEEIGLLVQSAEATKGDISQMTTREYVGLLDRAYRAHKTTLDDTADKGVDLHSELERFVRWHMNVEPEPAPLVWHPRIQPFIEWTDKNVDRFLWSEMNVYSERWWLGGISDCGLVDKQGRYAILDFKSSKEAYLSAFWQAAGYDLQIMENRGGFDADGNRTTDDQTCYHDGADYYAILPFGMEKPEVQINEDVKDCRENFLHALALYKALPRD